VAYEALAAFYDEFMDDVDYDKWADYITEILNKYGSELRYDSKIVDLACGTAELTCKMSKKTKAEYFAVDNSEDMLCVAAEKAKEYDADITFYCQDMAAFNITFLADAAISTGDGVNYLTPESVPAFFKRVYDQLKSGSVFTFDISSAYKLINLLGNNIIAEDRGDIAFIWENTLLEGCVQIDLSIFRQDHDDRYIKTEEQQMQFIYEEDYIVKLLKKAGFDTVYAFGFQTFEKADADCERIQFVAVK